ncbi:MAG TPA: NUDIX hydrolase [Caulobacteraceae bacterium]|jgi:8-oxo-dGTP pyrophosphatase MutT (NUDIX family)|nr:NUDIX hydrolase [Caulobacteraceae bacterium]
MTLGAFDDIGPATPGNGSPGARPVRPRDAATLIIVDHRQADRPKVLMGRRNGRHDFMPDKWVFPGGRIDPADFRAPHGTDLRHATAERLQKTAPPARARALAMAAIRETFEEAGLLLAKPAPTRPGAGPWREFLAQGALPDLDALEFVARAVTPPMSPKRFDARFFMAGAERLISLDRQADCGELDEIAWFAMDEALELDLPSVTRFVLHEVPARLADPRRPVPSLRFSRGKQQLRHL